jgi:hypothetical protein
MRCIFIGVVLLSASPKATPGQMARIIGMAALADAIPENR